jgi:8-oxo-dGTP pyrophosphatase MutT (NUDIX family)
MKDAVAILIENEGKYLFVQRPPGDLYQGYWSPPTGKVEPGESQAQTVAREAMEELGLPVEPGSKVWESVTTTGQFRLHWWTARPLSLDIKPDPVEISGVTWIKPGEIRSLGNVFDAHVYFFENINLFI